MSSKFEQLFLCSQNKLNFSQAPFGNLTLRFEYKGYSNSVFRQRCSFLADAMRQVRNLSKLHIPLRYNFFELICLVFVIASNLSTNAYEYYAIVFVVLFDRIVLHLDCTPFIRSSNLTWQQQPFVVKFGAHT